MTQRLSNRAHLRTSVSLDPNPTPSIQISHHRRYPGNMPYDPTYADQARHVCHLGATDEEVAEYLGVRIRTLDHWRTIHSDFAEAFVLGGEHADARVARGLMMFLSALPNQSAEPFPSQ